MAWPTTLAKTHLDEPSDDPSQARAELVALLDSVNSIIALRAALSGICDLDAAGKIPAARLTDVITNPCMAADAIQSAEIKAGEVNFLHWKATLTNTATTPTGGADGDIHLIYE